MATCSFEFSRSNFQRSSIAAAALLLLAAGADAQTTTTLPAVTVTARSEPAAAISGWGTMPLSQTPLQATVLGTEQIKDKGMQRLADLVKTDPAISDAYKAEGYWDYLAIRGFVIDNRFNYRRDGLPINAETSIPLDNKERIEVLKGTSGIQAGTSAPGGLVNLVVKRPTDAPIREVQIGWRQHGSVLGTLDLGQRFGENRAFGLRLNAAYEHLDPALRSARGERHLLALAGDWRASSNTLLEAEFETSHRSQPSQPGFSMLGDTVPAPTNPRINLNNQPWSQPVVMDANTASLRMTHNFSSDWRFTAHAATQRLRSDDRLAYAYGCGAEGNYSRYCTDGSFDLYDYRSENERRRTDALELALSGEFQTGALQHSSSVGVLQSRVRNRFQRQAYNRVGTGFVDGSAVTAPDPILTDDNTNRDERSTELFVRDAVRLTESLTAWLGLRHTRLSRESVQTDGTQATSYPQSINTPWFAASYSFAPEQMLYAGWGRGVQSEVVPNRDRYTNAGQALPAQKSRQIELGLKVGTSDANWSFAWFDIVQPVSNKFGANCDDDSTPASCTRQMDGEERHRGMEADASWRTGAWTWRGGVQVLQARREGSLNASLNGHRPTNVPARILKLQAAYRVPAAPGLELQADTVAESDRTVLPDQDVRIPGYGRADLSARYEQKRADMTLVWRAGVDNLFDRRVWRESPYQFDHVYLYPLEQRTFRLSLSVSL